MVSNTGGRIASARVKLARLAERPLIKRVDLNHCDPALADLLSMNPGYSNVSVTDMDGLVVCSAVPQPDGKPVNIQKAPWFQTFLKNKSFTVGKPFLGPITGKWVSVISEPIYNDQHEMVGGVQLSLDLKAFDPNISAHLLPKGTRYGFQYEDGTLIWRNVDPEGAIGARGRSAAAQRIGEIKDGEFESTGSDGVLRFFSVVTMPEIGWIAFVGIPVSEAYATPRQRSITATVIALGLITLLTTLAITITRRIAEPIAGLERATHAVLNGNLGAKVAINGPTEVINLATTFNAMTEKIEAATRLLEAEITERMQKERALRRSEYRLERAEKIAHVGHWSYEVADQAVEWSDELWKIFGRQPGSVELTYDAFTSWIREDFRAFHHEKANQMLALRPGETVKDFIYCLVRPDGEQRWVEVFLESEFDENDKPLRFFGVVEDITEKKLAQEALLQSLKDKEALLHEVHHRVKNNLQVVISLLRLEGGRSAQTETKAVLTEMQGRIRSMAVLHESLYRAGVFASVELGKYLRTLATEAFRAQVQSSGSIRLVVDMTPLQVGMDLAIPCGLLVNELISNCLKHGFPQGRSGEVKVELHPAHPDAFQVDVLWRLCVRDNGVGLPPDFEAKRKTSLGLQLVGDLSRQIGGTLEIQSHPDAGAEFAVIFKLPASALQAQG